VPKAESRFRLTIILAAAAITSAVSTAVTMTTRTTMTLMETKVHWPRQVIQALECTHEATA
jgi:hypothetical protein